ncbi:RhuM family protein [Pseudobacteroides cellulosolvens]|uniref:RhuM family protein n=1 Tax=Pseudobacteroides cellulosolvens TaxID=35825 RepID=UPI003908AEA3
MFYNLDAVISEGYRVNSKKATQFRKWATKTPQEFILKGFVLNDKMLKNLILIPLHLPAWACKSRILELYHTGCLSKT